MTSATDSSATKFIFNDPIVSTIKDPISNKTLVKRLKSLFNKLCSIEQEDSTALQDANLRQITQQLMNKKLISNQDYGIKSFVALCIGEILRIFAPNAPYTNNQLLEFFKLFQTILKNTLYDANQSMYFNENVNFLSRLAEVRSIILITDLSNSSDLIENVFDICYTAPPLQATHNDSLLLSIIAEILSSVISEINIISQDLLKLILNQFFYSDNPKRANSHYFTTQICSNNPERMARQISQFVSETLFENSKNETVNKRKRKKRKDKNNDDEDENNSYDSLDEHEINKPLSEIQLQNLTKIHKLILEIWKKFPDLLSASLGFINSELFHENENIRILAVALICKLIETSNFNNNGSNFIKVYNAYYSNLIHKSILDVSSKVRICWIENVITLLTSQNENINFNLENKEILINGVIKCLLDTNEKIRLKTVQLFISKKFYLKLFPSNNCPPVVKNFIILKTLKQLTREKKFEIRNESIKFLCLIFNNKIMDLLCDVSSKDLPNFNKLVLASDIERMTDITTTDDLNLLIKWIPDHLLSLIYINSKSINQLIDSQLTETILNLVYQNVAEDYCIARYLTVCNNLSDKSKIAFFTITKRGSQISAGFAQLLKLIQIYYNDKIYLNSNKKSLMESKLKKVIAWLVSTLPTTIYDDSSSASSAISDNLQNMEDDEFYNINYLCMVKFIRMNSKRLFNLVNKIIDPASDLITIHNSMKEFFNKLKSDPAILNSYYSPNRTSDNTEEQIKDDDQFNVFENYSALNSVTVSQMERTFKGLFYRSSNFYYNKDIIDKLLEVYDCSYEYTPGSQIDPNSPSSDTISKLLAVCRNDEKMIITTTHCLEDISKVYPNLFNSFHRTKLVDLINSYMLNGTDNNKIMGSNNDILKTLLKLLHNFYSKESITKDKSNSWLIPDSFIQTLISLCLDQTRSTPIIARYAIRILCTVDDLQSFNSVLIKDEILKHVYPLRIDENELFAVHLAVLTEIMVLRKDLLIDRKNGSKRTTSSSLGDENYNSEFEANDIGEDKSSIITSFLIKNVLLAQSEIFEDEKKEDKSKDFIDDKHLESEWRNDPLVNSCYCKVLSLRFLACRIKSMYLDSSPDEDNEHVQSNEIVNLIMKLLVSCISNGGELTKNTPLFIQAKLRSYAGLMLLKISKIPIINKHYLTALVFNKFALLIQDEIDQVRKVVLTKLIKYVNSDLISNRYSCLLFFAAYEPDKKLLEQARGCILSGFQKQLHSGDLENVGFEKLFVRLLYTIAHQQEFVELVQEAYEANNENSNELLFKAFGFASKIIIFYLSVILTQDNISLIYYLAGRIKQYKDVTDSNELQIRNELSQESYNIYRVSDLACLVIQTYNAKVNHHNFNTGSKKGWIIDTWPGKIQLSRDMFKSMDSSKEQRNISGMMFIPDEITKKLELFIRAETSSMLGHASFMANNNNNNNGTDNGTNSVSVTSRIKKSSTNKKQNPLKKSSNINVNKKAKMASEKVPNEPTRRSSRIQKKETVNYAYVSDDEDEIEA